MKYIILFCSIPIFTYCLLTVIPSYIGCILPNELCLTGSNKLVDILVIWTYTMPVFVFFSGYTIWRKQKIEELLAIDARVIFSDLKEFELKLDDFLKNKMSDSDVYEALIVLNTLYAEVYKKVEIFNDLLEEEGIKNKKDWARFRMMFWELGSMFRIAIQNMEITIDEVKIKRKTDYDVVEYIGSSGAWFNEDLNTAFTILRKIILHKL